jgi:hypothetical protein
LKDFVKRNVEDYTRYKQERLKAKDSYFYKDLKAKPAINNRSKKIVRSISATNAEKFSLRPWTQKSALTFTSKFSLAN